MAEWHKGCDHPGSYVRENIIPPGMSVTVAAERLGISRVALSNFLNGKSGLSPRMAARLEKAFGADRKRLVEMQSGHDRQERHAEERQIAVRAFVPSFLSIKARQVGDWAANDISARSLLPVLLRKLVHSTSDDLSRVDFPGYDNAQRKGCDGFVDAGAATPWVPVGRSYWEFGTQKQPPVKANKDYAARLDSVSAAERRASTFISVTTTIWPGRADWERQKNEAGEWRSVRAYDASDIEQWLEQSVPAQIWLAEQLGLPTSGFETLEQAWVRWADASEPRLTPDIFTPAVVANREKFKNWLDKPCDRPFVVAADSRLEALAFLACLFDDQSLDASKKDLAAVFTSRGPLRMLIDSSVPFIPIVHGQDTETELGSAYNRLHCIIFRHRNSVELNADVELKLLRDDHFRNALNAMGYDDTKIERLARESGRSPTILRRRLSTNSAIGTPEWASDDSTGRALVAMSLVGAWCSDVDADQEIVSQIANRKYDEVELDVRVLLGLDDSPVWSSGRYRGVASKIDALFAVASLVTKADLERFFDSAEIVLSESDPALDLPEEDRWAAAIYERVRKYSAQLRESICETLVLLSVHGNNLFRNQLGINVEGIVETLIHELLAPLTIEKLLCHDEELPYYAEAAPEVFLGLLERDRQQVHPVVLGLLKPTSGDPFFTSPTRTGLLWALECLAWNPMFLARVSRLLAWLSLTEINDNWTNKPDESLKAIFRSWMPQTAASPEERLATLKLLVKEFPDIGWALCIDHVEPGMSFGTSTYKPRWRNDASGAGQVVTNQEVFQSWRNALDVLIGWPSHNEKTLGDLVRLLDELPEKDELLLWERIREWSQESDEGAKATLREQVRQSVFTSYGRQKNIPPATRARARAAYDRLRPDDPVIRHMWLFVDQWVRASEEETDEDDLDDLKHEEAIDRQRREAIAEICSEHGFDGVRDLLSQGVASHVVGYYAALPESGVRAQIDFICRCLAIDGVLRNEAEQCLKGFFSGLSDDRAATVLRDAADELDGNELKRLFACAPFQESTWRILDDYGSTVRKAYWRDVIPSPRHFTPSELTELIDCLLDAGRPRASFHAVSLRIKEVETSRLKRLLFDVARGDAEPSHQYTLDRYRISKALDSLDGRSGVTPNEMALLEFWFIDGLDDGGHGIPNLQAQMVESPELFVRMVAFAYKRNDDGEDPPTWRIEDPTRNQALALAAHQHLDQIKRIPGEDENGKIQAEALTKWINEVRQLCRKHGRVEIGDELIGQLLSRAPAGESGDRPCEEVCQAMEEIASLHIGRGFSMGVYNSRGVHSRREGGDQERELAKKYRATAQRLRFKYPNVGSVLEHIARSYDHDADWHDAETEKDKRLHV